jgi:hypothetical protein
MLLSRGRASRKKHPPVLDAGAGLHALELGGDAPHAATSDRVEVHQRRVPDQLLIGNEKKETISFLLSHL